MVHGPSGMNRPYKGELASESSITERHLIRCYSLESCKGKGNLWRLEKPRMRSCAKASKRMLSLLHIETSSCQSTKY